MFLRIGRHELAAGGALAPMAGGSDAVMRNLCAEYGAIFTVSEMVSAKAITMADKKSFRLLRTRGGSAPYGVQLFGHEPPVLAEAVQCLEQQDFDFIDLNLGCPAPKIVKSGSGSALLKDPAKAGAFARAAVKASARPVTAKMRIGWDDDTLTGAEVARRCEDAGVQLLVVHGRTRAQQYAPGVRYEEIAHIKRAVSIPVLCNGDVADGPSARAAVQRTGCDGVMIGRGAMGSPWVFAQVAAALQNKPLPKPPPLAKKLAILDKQVRGMCEQYGEAVAMPKARGVAAAYLKGLHGAAALRHMAYGLTYYQDLQPLIAEALRRNPG